MARKRYPIKFKSTLEGNFKKRITILIKENRKIKSALSLILAIAAMGGILAFGAVAPGALGVIGKIFKDRQIKKREKYRKIWRSFYELKKKRIFEFIEEKDGYLVYRITNKGKEKIKKLIFNKITIDQPKRWDKKWRLVIFDIPETRYKTRTVFRNKLKEMGFYQCQKSVWIYPFHCLEEIEFLKKILNIKPFVKLFLIEEMGDGKVLYYFRDLLKNSL